MTSLLNSLTLKAGLFEDMAKDNSIKWFEGINKYSFFMNLVIPLIFLIIFSFTVLKKRYKIHCQRMKKRGLD